MKSKTSSEKRELNGCDVIEINLISVLYKLIFHQKSYTLFKLFRRFFILSLLLHVAAVFFSHEERMFYVYIFLCLPLDFTHKILIGQLADGFSWLMTWFSAKRVLWVNAVKEKLLSMSRCYKQQKEITSFLYEMHKLPYTSSIYGKLKCDHKINVHLYWQMQQPTFNQQQQQWWWWWRCK